ncbi:MAG: HAD-IIB family hydrolase [Candidatus Hydrothermarchaeota archaeon]
MDINYVFEKKGVSSNIEIIKELIREVKIIYTDIDGTLVGPDGSIFRDDAGKLSIKIAEALLYTHMLKKDVVMVSGRTNDQLKSNAELLGFKNYIAELGTQIVYNLGEKVYYNIGDFQVTGRNIYESIMNSGAPDSLLERYEGKLEYHTPWSEYRDCTVLLRGHVDLREANSFLRDSGYENLKLVDNGVINVKTKNLSVSEIHAYHLLPKESGKKSAVEKDKEIRNIKKEEAISIGESASDIEIAEVTQIFFLVRNGLENDPSLVETVLNSKNIFVLEKRMGLGWAEAIDLLRQSQR